MLANSIELITEALQQGVAVAAFNTYNIETTGAIVQGAEKLNQPVILQLGVQALKAYGEPYVAAVLAAARVATVPVAVHLDHCSDYALIEKCFELGVSSALADGSHLPFEENIAFTRRAAETARRFGASIEAELGRLSGTEDGITIEMLKASLTDPSLAKEFISSTGADMLAVSIGNIHGFAPDPPPLDFELLSQIRQSVSVPLVLHGASGMEQTATSRAIAMGVGKLNVNTEVRVAFLQAVAGWGIKVGPNPDPRQKGQDLLDLTKAAMEAAQQVVMEKIKAFGTKN